LFFFFSSRRRHTRFSRDWSSDVCSSDLMYECVADVFRLFDAIFRIGTNDVIEIEYFNDLSKEEIAQATFSGRNTSISEDKYANRSEERRVGKEYTSGWKSKQ